MFFYIDTEGVVQAQSENSELFKNASEISKIDLNKFPVGDDLIRPKWDGSKWVESEDIQNLKNLTLGKIKREAALLIQKIAPSHKQTNWILDNQLDDPEVQKKIQEIKRIREKSNELEKSLNKKKSVNAVKNFEIDFSE